MRKIILTAVAAILASAGATSAMAFSSDYGDPSLFGNVPAAAAPGGVDAGYPPRIHTRFGQLAPYEVGETPVAANSGFVSVPVGGAVGFTRDFGFGDSRWNARIPQDPAGTSGYRLR